MTLPVTPLTGKLLIAMPDMADPRFVRTVICICEHGPAGALGLVVNKPQDHIDFRTLLTEIDITPGDTTPDVAVHYGGPVEMGRGFVLHSDDYTAAAGTVAVATGIAMTATRDALEDIAAGRGPQRALLALGYAGWGPGQLDAEIRQNGWLTCDAQADLVFAASGADTWTGALRCMGIDPLLLSSVAGRA